MMKRSSNIFSRDSIVTVVSCLYVLCSLIQPHCGSLAPPAAQWQRRSQSHRGPEQQAAGLHERHGGAAARGGPAFSPRPWPGQGPWAGPGHGGGLLAGPRSAAQADRAALTPPVPTPAQETGGAQVSQLTETLRENLTSGVSNLFDMKCHLK